ncbi:hypothetical protein FQZ97_628600 [compost metagenome]
MIPRLELHHFPLQAHQPVRSAQALADRVLLTIRIDTLDALNLRITLHRSLGRRIGVYMLSVDHAHAQSVLQLQCDRSQVDTLMHAVMSGLPRAEFGAVRPVHAMAAR